MVRGTTDELRFTKRSDEMKNKTSSKEAFVMGKLPHGTNKNQIKAHGGHMTATSTD